MSQLTRRMHGSLMNLSNPHSIDPQLLMSFLDEGTSERLEKYFHSGKFTGGRFEAFAGGGDRPEAVNVIDADDIVAVSLLSVRIPGRAALQLLEERRDQISGFLSEIPPDVDLWDTEEDTFAEGSEADELWRLVEGLPGSGWVTAGKLLARKRPRLIPVYDRVVHASLQRPERDSTFWQDLRVALRDNPAIVDRLRALHGDASLGNVSLLRTLDVAIWMKSHGQPEPTPPAEA